MRGRQGMKRIIKSVIIELLPGDILTAFVLWGFLIGARISGVITWPWWFVLTCGAEIFLCLILANVLLFAIIAPLLYLKDYIKRRNRRRKVDARIIAQAKAAGVWDKPYILGGRALELKAWEDFRIKRRAGESDVELRRRCMNAADNELADLPAYSTEKNHTERG